MRIELGECDVFLDPPKGTHIGDVIELVLRTDATGFIFNNKSIRREPSDTIESLHRKYEETLDYPGE